MNLYIVSNYSFDNYAAIYIVEDKTKEDILNDYCKNNISTDKFTVEKLSFEKWLSLKDHLPIFHL